MLKNHVFGSFNLNKSEKHRLSFEDIFLGTLDTYTKKMNPPSAVLGGGVHGKVSWLIAYYGYSHLLAKCSNYYTVYLDLLPFSHKKATALLCTLMVGN